MEGKGNRKTGVQQALCRTKQAGSARLRRQPTRAACLSFSTEDQRCSSSSSARASSSLDAELCCMRVRVCVRVHVCVCERVCACARTCVCMCV